VAHRDYNAKTERRVTAQSGSAITSWMGS